MNTQLIKSPVDAWISKLASEEMPAFAHTARSLASVSREDDSSANDLANVILRDSAMTARILRLANSAHFNVSGRPIETVSYAIVVLGFQHVRNMALTISMIDTVLDSVQKEKVQQEMICAYHAAVQAQRLAQQTDAEQLEAVYIGALLHRLGQIMFWCYPFEQGEALLGRYGKGCGNDEVEREVLGFSLRELTSTLVSEWQLSEMLDDVLSRKKLRSEDSVVGMGLAISDGAQQGWQSEAFNSQLSVVADHLDMSVSDAKEYVFEGAREGTKGLYSFGFPQTDALLPPDEPSELEEGIEKPDADLEIAILRQLTHMLGENVDLNKMVMAVLEGIYRVIEMETVVFALVDNKTKTLKPKFMLGPRRDEVMSKSTFPATDGEFLKYLNSLTAPAWHKPGNQPFNGQPDPLIHLSGTREYFVSVVTLSDRVLGAIYASKSADKKALTDENLQSFSHLCDHMTLAFRILANNR